MKTCDKCNSELEEQGATGSSQPSQNGHTYTVNHHWRCEKCKINYVETDCKCDRDCCVNTRKHLQQYI